MLKTDIDWSLDYNKLLFELISWELLQLKFQSIKTKEEPYTRVNIRELYKVSNIE